MKLTDEIQQVSAPSDDGRATEQAEEVTPAGANE